MSGGSFFFSPSQWLIAPKEHNRQCNSHSLRCVLSACYGQLEKSLQTCAPDCRYPLTRNDVTGRARHARRLSYVSFQDGGRSTTTERRATTFFMRGRSQETLAAKAATWRLIAAACGNSDYRFLIRSNSCSAALRFGNTLSESRPCCSRRCATSVSPPSYRI